MTRKSDTIGEGWHNHTLFIARRNRLSARKIDLRHPSRIPEHIMTPTLSLSTIVALNSRLEVCPHDAGTPKQLYLSRMAAHSTDIPEHSEPLRSASNRPPTPGSIHSDRHSIPIK